MEMKPWDEFLDFIKMIFVGLLITLFLLLGAIIVGKCSYENRNEEPSWGRGL
jgi:hypothetical protein